MEININKDIWQYLQKTEKPIVLYGMGNGADKILNLFEKRGISAKGVFASDSFVRDKVFRGFKIKSYAQIKEEFKNFIVIVAFGTQLPEVLENINKIAQEQELYAIDVAVYGNTVFDLNYYNSKREEFENLYNLLADDQSKKVLKNTVLFKLTGKIEYLQNCETEKAEAVSLLKLKNNESFLDLGAYRGDTVLEFVQNVKKYNNITAVEPDKKTFKKLHQNTLNLKNINLVNACVGEKDGQTEFNMSGDRNAHLGKGETVNVVTVDSLAKQTVPSFIKMDIEGEELFAIKGATETVKKYKPKMQIACYHRTEDFIDLYKAVLNLNGNYKIYLRHFKYIPAWDINFYFI